jgi:hypothetical protein
MRTLVLWPQGTKFSKQMNKQAHPSPKLPKDNANPLMSIYEVQSKRVSQAHWTFDYRTMWHWLLCQAAQLVTMCYGNNGKHRSHGKFLNFVLGMMVCQRILSQEMTSSDVHGWKNSFGYVWRVDWRAVRSIFITQEKSQWFSQCEGGSGDQGRILNLFIYLFQRQRHQSCELAL